jgi:NAD dependent epimerase/dehydratase family enzyme
VLFGGMSETVTASQRQVPERGMAAGFSFVHTDLDESLDDLLS